MSTMHIVIVKFSVQNLQEHIFSLIYLQEQNLLLWYLQKKISILWYLQEHNILFAQTQYSIEIFAGVKLLL